MKRLLFLVFLLSSSHLCLLSGTDFKIPQKDDIFAIATEPFGPNIFTPATLLKDLNKYRIGLYEETGLKVGDDRAWQGGVIILNNKKALFWGTDRKRFLRIKLENNQDVYLIRVNSLFADIDTWL